MTDLTVQFGDTIEYRVHYTHLGDEIMRYDGFVKKITHDHNGPTYHVVRQNGNMTGMRTVDLLGPRDIVKVLT